MSIAERLLARLREQGAELPPCTELRRTYRHSCTVIGSWSWFAWCPLCVTDPAHHGHGDLHYGSHWPAWVLLRAKGLAFTRDDYGSICVDPVPERESLDLWRTSQERRSA